jgi:hypothetical protein
MMAFLNPAKGPLLMVETLILLLIPSIVTLLVPTVKIPVTLASPTTVSFDVGFVVPIPTNSNSGI